MCWLPVALNSFDGPSTFLAEAGWQFTEVPVSQIVPEGSNVVLRCSVQGAVGDCLWLKDGRNIGFNLARLPHLTWAGDHASGDCSLAITGAQHGRDDGSWVCEMTGDAQHPTITSPPAVLVVSGELARLVYTESHIDQQIRQILNDTDILFNAMSTRSVSEHQQGIVLWRTSITFPRTAQRALPMEEEFCACSGPPHATAKA